MRFSHKEAWSQVDASKILETIRIKYGPFFEYNKLNGEMEICAFGLLGDKKVYVYFFFDGPLTDVKAQNLHRFYALLEPDEDKSSRLLSDSTARLAWD
jgi:hypothetical protein